MRCKGAADDSVVEDRSAKASIDNALFDGLDAHPVGCGKQSAIMGEFLIDFGLPESSFSGDIFELRRYLRSRMDYKTTPC